MQRQESEGAGVWEAGDRLADRFEIQETLRRSSTCCLYRAKDNFRGGGYLVLGPGTKLVDKPTGLDWFERYCDRMLDMPPHPNLLTPRQIDQHHEITFLVLPDAEGIFWDEGIQNGVLTELSQMLDVAGQVARGVAWLHRHGQTHHNLKPANVILCDYGFAKLWKYGQAGARTRAYASPEQITGDRMLTPATDAWSWALCVLEMFNGRPNWQRGDDGREALESYLERGSRRNDLPPMPDALAELLEHCLKVEPEERPADMKEVVSALESVSAAPEQAPEPTEEESAEVQTEADAEAQAEAESSGEDEGAESEDSRRRFSEPRRRRSDTGHWRLHQT